MTSTIPTNRQALPLQEHTGQACSNEQIPLLDVDRAEALASGFSALSDPTRVRLLAHIAAAADGTVCACHLPEALGISQPTLSHHLKKLTAAGLIVREQRGRWAHYTAVDEKVQSLSGFLQGTCCVAPGGKCCSGN